MTEDEYQKLPRDSQNRTKLFVQYHNMLGRCYNTNNEKFPSYGARGIKVCIEWQESFHNYKTWALANGYEDGLQIDKDVKSSHLPIPIYSPETCCFLTKAENMAQQVKETRANSKITILQLENGNIIKTFSTYNEATINTGIASANISAVCRGKRKSAGGFQWKLA